MVQLIHYPLCPWSRTARVLLTEYGINARLAEEKPWAWRPEFLAVNPGGNLPVLLVDHVAICGIYPITDYLLESAPRDDERPPPELIPDEPYPRAEMRRMIDWFHQKFYDEVWRYIAFERIENPFIHRGNPNPDAIRAAMANARNHLAYISRLLEERYWLGGDYLSVADLTAASHISCLDYLGDLNWDNIPLVKNWYARIKSRPSFRPLLNDTIPSLVPPPHYVDLDF